MEPYSLSHLFEAFNAASSEVALYLPRTTDIRRLAKYAKKDEKLQVVHYCIKGASKALTVYYGSFEVNADRTALE